MLSTTVSIGGREVTFATNGATPRLYRAMYKRDLIKDLSALENRMKEVEGDEDGYFQIIDLEMFENVAHVMAIQGDPATEKKIDDWLAKFETFDIYTVLPEILGLWTENNTTLEESKKK